MSQKISYVILIFLSCCSGGANQDARETSSNEISKVRLKDLNDKEIDLDQFKGKTVFINFWATWCKPCLQEMPSIESAQTELKNQKIVFLLASNEEVDQIESFIKKNRYTFQYVHLENMEDLGIQALPTTYIFNSEGKLKFSETGSRQWNDAASLDLITKIMNDHEK